MLLTGLALKNFINYSSSGDGYIFLNEKTTKAIHYELLTEDVLIPLIIYWFDSVGNLKDKGCVYSFKNLYLKMIKELEKKHSRNQKEYLNLKNSKRYKIGNRIASLYENLFRK